MNYIFTNKRDLTLIFYYLLYIYLIAYTSLHYPSFNWDMIGYVASAKHYEINNLQELHTFVFSNLKEYISPNMFHKLTSGDNNFRDIMYANYHLFAEQLPFYDIRVFYNLSILLLSYIGINIFTATFLSSTIFTAISILLILFAIKDKVNIYFLYALPFFLQSFKIVYLAQLSTPDAMALLSISIFIYLLSREKITILLFIMPLFILVRTDLIIFNIFAYALIFYKYRGKLSLYLFSAISSIIFLITINHIFGHYGWVKLIVFTFIERFSNIADVNVSLTLKEYLNIINRGIDGALNNIIFMGYLAMIIVSIALYNKLKKVIDFNKEVFIYLYLSISYTLIHFILFPVTWNRFFIPYYILCIVAFLIMLSNLINSYSKLTKG